MLLGVVSDTHARFFSELSPKVLQALSGVDLIIHCGDFTTRDVLDGLRRFKEVRAVHGNMDSPELQRLLPDREIMELEGCKIGITHGFGPPVGIERRLRRTFDAVDIIIYGHSHISQNKMIDGILFFNPGTGRKSCGILRIEEKMDGKIIKF
jgi:putative phosphoesterase